MSNFVSRLERLETRRKDSNSLVIGLPRFAPDGELSAYQCGDELIFRHAGEERAAFVARVRGLRKADIIVLFGKDDMSL